jgi:outer membrane protein insertion porin family
LRSLATCSIGRASWGGPAIPYSRQYGLQHSFIASLTEPWFLGYKLSVGAEAYYHEANFLSDVYDQSNYGLAILARREIWRALSGRVEYRIEGIHIFNVNEDSAGQVIRDSAGFFTKSVFTGALVWDTRDSLFLTRKGVIQLTGFYCGGALGDRAGLRDLGRKARSIFFCVGPHIFD